MTTGTDSSLATSLAMSSSLPPPKPMMWSTPLPAKQDTTRETVSAAAAAAGPQPSIQQSVVLLGRGARQRLLFMATLHGPCPAHTVAFPPACICTLQAAKALALVWCCSAGLTLEFTQHCGQVAACDLCIKIHHMGLGCAVRDRGQQRRHVALLEEVRDQDASLAGTAAPQAKAGTAFKQVQLGVWCCCWSCSWPTFYAPTGTFAQRCSLAPV